MNLKVGFSKGLYPFKKRHAKEALSTPTEKTVDLDDERLPVRNSTFNSCGICDI